MMETLTQSINTEQKEGFWYWNVRTGEFCFSNQWKKVFGNSCTDKDDPKNHFEQRIHPNDLASYQQWRSNVVTQKQDYKPLTYRLLSPEGIPLTVHESAQIVEKDNAGTPIRIVGCSTLVNKVTKSAEQIRLELAADIAGIGYYELDVRSGTSQWDQRMRSIFEFDNDANVDLMAHFYQVLLPQDKDRMASELAALLQPTQEDTDTQGLFRIQGKGHEIKHLQFRSKVVRNQQGEAVKIIGTCTDVTEQKQQEKLIEDSSKRWESLFHHSPVPLWEEDLTAVKQLIDELKQQGITDFEKHFTEHPQKVFEVVDRIQLLDINNASLLLHEASSKEELLTGLHNIFTEHSIQGFIQQLVALANGKMNNEVLSVIKTLKGNQKDILLSWNVVPGYEETYARVYVATLDVTNEQKAKALLKESEERFKNIVEQSPLAIQVYDLDGSLKTANRQTLDLFGLKDDLAIQEFNFWNDPNLTPQHAKALKQGKPVLISATFDFDLVPEFPSFKTGVVHLDMHIHPLEVHGTTTGYIVQIVETTEQVNREFALGLSEERLRLSTNLARVAVWEYNIATSRMFRSENHDSLYGLPQQEVWSLETLKKATHPDDWERSQNLISQSISAGGPDKYNYDFRTVWPDKTQKWLSVVAEVAQRDENGIATLVRGCIYDITERKETELELNKLSTATNQSPASIVVTDTKGNIEYVNPRFTETYGYTQEEIIGKHTRILKSGYTSPEEYKTLWSTIKAGKTWVGEFKNRKKDGTYLWEQASIGPIVNERGKIINYVAIKEDISELKNLEHKLRSTLENLEDTVNERTLELQEKSKELEHVHNEFMSSLHYAKGIQRASLPSLTEQQEVFSGCFNLYRPKDIVSGDFYWLHKNNNHIVLAMADCTGHGVPGAMMSMAGHEMLDTIVIKRQVYRPDVILEELDLSMAHLLQRKNAWARMNDGMDVSILHIEIDKKTLTYAGAQSHGIFISGEDCIALKPSRKSIGGVFIGEYKRFDRVQLNYDKGDKVYLFSDGFYDQFGGPEGKKLLRNSLCGLLKTLSHLPMKEQGEKLEKFFDKWKGDNDQIDDVTVIGIEL